MTGRSERQSPLRWNRLVLGSAALGIAAIGVIYLFTPQTLLSVYGIELQSASEANLYRSGYGGLFLAFSLVFASGAIAPRRARTAQLTMLAFMGGLAGGRLVSLVADGWPHPLLTAILVVELTYAGAAAALLTVDG
jgi:hypothetical protein